MSTRQGSTRRLNIYFVVCVVLVGFFVLVVLGSYAPLQMRVIASAMILGACIGSFANVVIWRLPIMLMRSEGSLSSVSTQKAIYEASRCDPVEIATFNLAKPASACPVCGAKIASWHNLPIFSYCWLKGRCASCSTSISVRYPLIEATFAVAYGALAWHFGLSFALFSYAILFSGLAVLFLIDWDTQLLPDVLTQPLLWLGLLANSYGLHTPLESAVWGAVGGYTLFWLVAAAFHTWTGKDGMGHGDFKLMGVLGAWLGWQSLPWVMGIGGGVSIMLILARVLTKKNEWNDRQAFGPPLIFAGLVVSILAEFGISPPGFE